MDTGSNSAVPETPAKTGGVDDYDTEMLVETPGADEYTGRSVSFDEDANESGKAMEEDYDIEEKGISQKTRFWRRGEAAVRDPWPGILWKNFDEVVRPEPSFGNDDDDEEEDDGDDSKPTVTTSQVTEQKNRLSVTNEWRHPSGNKVLGRTYEEMMEKSTWIRLFEPKRIRQAVWADLSHELTVAVTATTTGQVASDTVQFLKSMGLQAQATPTQAVLESWIPAEAGADLWKWKRKLRVGFGVTDIHYPQPPVGNTPGGGVDPSKIPLPKTPPKGYNIVPKSHGVFSKSGDKTPYFQDSHIITPKSSGKKERSDRDSGRANATRSTMRGSRRSWDRNRYDADSSSSDDDDDIYRRPQQDGVLDEYIRQIEKASSPEGERLTQKLELATHRPLGQIRAFSGLQNKSENSMQWLR
ncbi:Eukaryotic/viral aspartic protease, partial [Phytophthora megakarya]